MFIEVQRHFCLFFCLTAANIPFGLRAILFFPKNIKG